MKKVLIFATLCSRHRTILLNLQRQFHSCKIKHCNETKTPLLAPPTATSYSSKETLPSDSESEPIYVSPSQSQVSPTSSLKKAEKDREIEDTTKIYDVRRVDPTTVKQVYFFDTLSLVKSLQSTGFTRPQAEGLAESLTEVINSTLEHQSRHMITKSQQEITVQQLMSEISSVKKDMVILQRSEFSSLRNETEKQTFEIRQIKDSLRDEIAKLKGQMTLDINLERSRAVEAHAENQKNLLKLNQKIETEVAHLRTIYEQYRNDVFKYAGGTVLTCAGLCLGILRLWS